MAGLSAAQWQRAGVGSSGEDRTVLDLAKRMHHELIHHGADLAPLPSMLAEAGHSAFDLHARVENDAAISFYLHCGWAMTGHRLEVVEHGITYEELVLVKDA